MMSAEEAPYRNATDAVTLRAQHLLVQHRQSEATKLGVIYRWRSARIAFGEVGVVAAACALFVVAFSEENQVMALALGWAAAFAAGIGGYLRAARSYQRQRMRFLGTSADPYELVLRLSKSTDADEEEATSLYQIARLGLSSHRLPLLVVAMLMPLTLIACFLFLIDVEAPEFLDGLRYGLAYTIHVHVYAVIAAWYFPLKQKATPVIAIAAGLGVIPIVVSGIVVGVIATLIMTLCFLPLSRWVNNENLWLIGEQERRIVARAAG